MRDTSCEGEVYLSGVGERGIVRAEGAERDSCAVFNPDAVEKELVQLFINVWYTRIG